MKFRLLICLLLLSTCVFAQLDKAIPPAPQPPRLVNDLAGLLTPEQREHLEQKLVAYDDSTSTQIAVVTVRGMKGYAAVDFATELGRQWGVGGSQFNNGIVLLVSLGEDPDDSGRDVFIATGYGLEGAIPDATANTILEGEIIPNLRAGNFYRAFEEGTSALMQAAAGEYTAPEGYSNRKKKGGGISLGKIIIILIILAVVFGMGGGGGRGGGFASRRGYRGFWGPPFIGGGGFGGGHGGGGFGGGGFGGFGGGGFGGGGAGGRW